MRDSKRPPPFSLRLSFEERAALEHDAADMPLGAYIRARVFDESRPPPRSRGKHPVKDHKELAGLMAALGNSRLEERDIRLARGDRRAHVAITHEGEVLSIARVIGKKTKDVAARLGCADDLRWSLSLLR